MSKNTKIQWCDDTVNPLMGCSGCELFSAPNPILTKIDERLGEDGKWSKGTARRVIWDLICETWDANFVDGDYVPGPGHHRKITTTNIYHLRKAFQEQLADLHGEEIAAMAREIIEEHVLCYAAKLHLNKGYSIVNPKRDTNKGYAPTFEQLTPFEGRIEAISRSKDLVGTNRETKPWLNGLPRLVFVSDMGDAFSRKRDVAFLRREITQIQSEKGRRHLWLWLTKRPHLMAEFADSLGGFSANVCAMTTVTSVSTLHRIDELRKVNAQVRGLSIEPLWTRLPRRKLCLHGIDWVILGGESGGGDIVTPFRVEWAEEVMEHCRDQGVAFFLKQLGRRPTWKDCDIELKDKHGGNFDEWEPHLRVREMPSYFSEYRN